MPENVGFEKEKKTPRCIECGTPLSYETGQDEVQDFCYHGVTGLLETTPVATIFAVPEDGTCS